MVQPDFKPQGRIVLADDHSDSADVAWLWVISHTWPGWQVEVVNVQPTGGADSARGAAEPGLTKHRSFPGGAHTAVSFEQLRGEPRAVLAGLKERDLLVVGPRGRGVLKALGLGSVSESLLHNPPMPLLIARRGLRTQRVLVCADGSAGCQAAVGTLLGMPWLGEAEVAVLTVPEQRLDAQEANSRCAQAIEGVARSVTARVLVPDPLQLVYHPRVMLLEAAEVWQADLLVMGHRGLSGLAALTAGSISNSLAGRAPCSVLVVRGD